MLLFLQATAESGSIVNELSSFCNLTPWDWIACCAGVFSLFVAILTAYFQARTEGNTKKMSRDLQISRLKGFYRHLYRNLIKVKAMQILIEREQDKGSNRIPSAENILKLELDEDDISEESFYSDKAVFEKMKNLKLQVRNVNIEVGVADRYLCSDSASREAKREILQVLLMKQGQIAMRIRDVLTGCFNETEDAINAHAKEAIVNSHNGNVDNNDLAKSGKLGPNDRDTSGNWGLNDIFSAAKNLPEEKDFFDIFYKDVEIELGLNKDNEPKIAMV